MFQWRNRKCHQSDFTRCFLRRCCEIPRVKTANYLRILGSFQIFFTTERKGCDNPSTLISSIVTSAAIRRHFPLLLTVMTVTNGVYAPPLGGFLQTIDGIDKLTFDDDGERNKALLAAYALVSRLESPWETVCRLAMTQVRPLCIL